MGSSNQESTNHPVNGQPLGTDFPSADRLQQELNQVRQELAQVKAERDEFRRYLYALTEKKIEFDEDEALALSDTQPSFGEYLAQLRQSLGA